MGDDEQRMPVNRCANEMNAGRGPSRLRDSVRRLRFRLAVCGLVVVVGAAGCGVPLHLSDQSAQRSATPSDGPEATPTPLIEADPALVARPTTGCPTPQVLRAPGTRAKRVALTFDDGPTPGTTEAILKILQAEGVRATFFDVGKFSVRYPELEYAVSRAGHTIGSHSVSHTRYTSLPLAGALRETTTSAQTIARNTGRPVCFVRPPYGETNPEINRALMRAGYSVVLWNADSRDWTERDPAAIIRSSLQGVGEQPVTLLMHSGLPLAPLPQPSVTAGAAAARATPSLGASASGDAAPPVLGALREVIRRYKAKGYTFVNVDGTPFTTPPPPRTVPPAGSPPEQGTPAATSDAS